MGAIRKEDALFLEQLKHALLTQPTDGNRDPRHWGIIEEKTEWGVLEENSVGWGIFDDENAFDQVGNSDDLASVIACLIDPENYDCGYAPDYEGCDTPEEVVEVANRLFEYSKFSVRYYADVWHVAEGPLFLTKVACEEHIRRYGYNYSKPHTYVMTADRCPEFEQLLRIIKETDWEALSGSEVCEE